MASSEFADEAERAELLAEARQLWPEIELASEAFFAHLDARLPVGKTIADLRTGDLYLSCALGRGDRRALAAFETIFMPKVCRAVAHMNLTATELDEVEQRLRHLLFVSDGAPAKIAEYSGAGELAGFVRVAAVRLALRLRRKGAIAEVEDDRLSELPGLGPSPEVAFVEESYREAFKQSFKQAFAALSSQEKNVIRQHHIDGLTLDQLATLHQTHRTTVARWLRQARQTLFATTRQLLMQKTRASESECDSIVRQVRSELDITIRSLFQ